jgi:hypothetical protein
VVGSGGIGGAVRKRHFCCESLFRERFAGLRVVNMKYFITSKAFQFFVKLTHFSVAFLESRISLARICLAE